MEGGGGWRGALTVAETARNARYNTGCKAGDGLHDQANGNKVIQKRVRGPPESATT